MLHEEAAHAGELVGLRREHDDVELEVGQVCAGQLEARRVVGILVADRTRELVGNPLLERLDRLAVIFALTGAS